MSGSGMNSSSRSDEVGTGLSFFQRWSGAGKGGKAVPGILRKKIGEDRGPLEDTFGLNRSKEGRNSTSADNLSPSSSSSRGESRAIPFDGSPLPPASPSNRYPLQGSIIDPLSPPSEAKDTGSIVYSNYTIRQFEGALDAENVDLGRLRKLAWTGIPWTYRTMTWQILLGYMPTNKSRRDATITRKRKDYFDSITSHFDLLDSDGGRTDEETELLRQIDVDLLRTCPMMPFFHQPQVRYVSS